MRGQKKLPNIELSTRKILMACHVVLRPLVIAQQPY